MLVSALIERATLLGFVLLDIDQGFCFRSVTVRDLRQTGYFAGFVDGEGSFAIRIDKRYEGAASFVLTITQRRDSAGVLEQVRDAFGGVLSSRYQRSRQDGYDSKPQVVWTVQARTDIERLICYFDAFPLIVKADEYAVWQAAARLYYRHAVGKGSRRSNPEWLVQQVSSLRVKLRAIRSYHETAISEIESQEDDRQCQLW